MTKVTTETMYGIPVITVVSSYKQVAAWVKRRWKVDLDPCGTGGGCWVFISENSGTFVLIWLPEYGTKSGDSTLLHELSHAAFSILHEVGVATGYKHQEAYCYLLEYLYSQTRARLETQ